MEMFVLGMVYASIAVFLSLWIFKDYASLVMVFLTVIATIPLMYATLKEEEENQVLTTSIKKSLQTEESSLI